MITNPILFQFVIKKNSNTFCRVIWIDRDGKKVISSCYVWNKEIHSDQCSCIVGERICNNESKTNPAIFMDILVFKVF